MRLTGPLSQKVTTLLTTVRPLVAPACLVLALCAAPIARADEVFGFPLRIGVYGGWHATPDDYDVLGTRRAEYLPGPGPMFGLRLGYRFDPMFTIGIDTGAAVVPVGDESGWLLPTRVVVDWRALSGIVTPLVGLGGGFVASVGPGGGDLDAVFAGTAGFEVRLGDEAALRFEGGVLATDGVDGLAWVPVVTFGLDFLAWRQRRQDTLGPLPQKVHPVGCPAGVSDALCHDADGDGRIDAFDQCPTEVGMRPDGCPDPDRDAVVGTKDACPKDRGVTADWGCPR